jgi:predicted nuclease of predicted toxin-antitoxin system
VAHPLLLDEMLSGVIAEQLRARGHDVVAVVDDSALIGLPDEEILAAAANKGRALVTANIKDFVPLDHRYKASGRSHAGLVLISAKAFPQDRAFIGAVVEALHALLNENSQHPDAVVFLQR